MTTYNRINRIVCLIIALILMGVFMSGCGTRAESGASSTADAEKDSTPRPRPRITTVVVVDVSEGADTAANTLAESGLKKAAESLNTGYDVIEVDGADEAKAALLTAAEAGNNPIFAVGDAFRESVLAAAAEATDTSFVAVGMDIPEPPGNLVALTFREEEAGYVAGVLAGVATQRGIRKGTVFGCVAPDSSPASLRARAGFAAGLASIDRRFRVVAVQATADSVSAGEVAGGTAIAKGAKIIYAVGAANQSGVARACSAKDALVIGYGGDLSERLQEKERGSVLGSLIERTDSAVYTTLLALSDDSLSEGTAVTLGLADGALVPALREFEKALGTEGVAALAKAQDEVKRGAVVVPVTP